MIARASGTRTNGLPMKITAPFLLAVLLMGCAQVVPDPSPDRPGMPLDPSHAPETDESAVTRASSRNLPSS